MNPRESDEIPLYPPGSDTPDGRHRAGTSTRRALILAVLLLLAYAPSWEAIWQDSASWVPQGLYSRDTLGNRLAAARIAQGRSLDISSFLVRQRGNRILFEQVVHERNGGLYPRFPPLTGILASPFFLFSAGPQDDLAGLLNAALRGLPQRELYAAALLTVAAVVIFFGVLRRTPELAASPGLAFALALILGLGTPFFASNSQALWSHTGSSLFICLALWLVWERDLTPRRILALGLVLGLAAWSRPSHLFTIALAGALLGWRAWRESPSARPLARNPAFYDLLAFIAGTTAVLAVAAGFNTALYGDLLGPYVRQLLSLGFAGNEPATPTDGPGGFLSSLAGTLISPSAGLFVFCPVLLLAFGGLRWGWQRSIWGRWALLTILVQWLLLARNPLWWGGWSWGPRLFADLAPLLVLLAVPAAVDLVRDGKAYLLGLVAALSIFLQALGVTSYDYSWHMMGPGQGNDPSSMWSLSEGIVLETLRGGKPRFSGEWPNLDHMEVHISGKRVEVLYDCEHPNVAVAQMKRLMILDDECRGGFLNGTQAWIPVPMFMTTMMGKYRSHVLLILPGPLAEADVEWSGGTPDSLPQELSASSLLPSTRIESAAPLRAYDLTEWLATEEAAQIGLRLPGEPIVESTAILPGVTISPLPYFVLTDPEPE